MKFRVALIIILLLFLAGSTAAADSAIINTEKVDQYIEREMKISRIPGLALGIVNDGDIVYLQGYGETGLGNDVDPQTPFIIGSVSKSFTAVAAMQLAEEDRLDLDAPVLEYLPWFDMAGEYDVSKMTVRHLLVQTSGIPWAAGLATLAENSSKSLEEEIRALRDVALEHPPGEHYVYSNTNYNILGLIIDLIADEGYSGHIQNKIFTPLGMENSFLTKEDGENNGMASGHVKWFGFPVATDVQYLDNSLAAGFIISSVEDMCSYMLIHLGRGSYNQSDILSEAGVAELHSPGCVLADDSNYAMGLVARKAEGTTLIMHDGAAQGFNSGMIFSPEEQWGVIVLTNFAGQLELPAMGVALGVSDIIKGSEPESNSRLWNIIYLGVLIILLVLIALTVRSLVMLPKKWAKKIQQNPPRGFFPVFGRFVLPIGLELLVPFLVFLYIPIGAGFSVWSLFALFHPDLIYSLWVLAVLMLFKGLWRSYLAFPIFRFKYGHII